MKPIDLSTPMIHMTFCEITTYINNWDKVCVLLIGDNGDNVVVSMIWDGHKNYHIMLIHVWGTLPFIVVLWHRGYRLCCAILENLLLGCAFGFKGTQKCALGMGRLGIWYSQRCANNASCVETKIELPPMQKKSSQERFVPTFIVHVFGKEGQSKTHFFWLSFIQQLMLLAQIQNQMARGCWINILSSYMCKFEQDCRRLPLWLWPCMHVMYWPPKLDILAWMDIVTEQYAIGIHAIFTPSHC